MKYFTYDSTSKNLNPLAMPIRYNGRVLATLLPAEAATLGAYPRGTGDVAPTPPEGKIAVPDGWEVQNGAWHRTWRYEDAPPAPPRVFDPYKLMDELMKRNVWDAVKEWLQAAPEGWDRWSKAPDIDEGEPLFKSAVAAAKTAFGWSDADVEAILAASVKEGY